MTRIAQSVATKGLILLLATVATAGPIPNPVANLIEIMKREPPKALPQHAGPDALKWQPALDFDKDSCYNTPAIGPGGTIAPGLPPTKGLSEFCRDLSDLNNNNVYVRTRCNHGWCAFAYDYYFEKDEFVANAFDGAGHRHEWEHIIVFVKDGQKKVVAASQHGDYETRDASNVRWNQDTHAKIVYHKDGGSTHAFRFANENEQPENAKGVWFRGALVGWDGFPSVELRNKLTSHDFGGPSMAIKDGKFKDNLNFARNDKVPGFDSGLVGPN